MTSYNYPMSVYLSSTSSKDRLYSVVCAVQRLSNVRTESVQRPQTSIKRRPTSVHRPFTTRLQSVQLQTVQQPSNDHIYSIICLIYVQRSPTPVQRPAFVCPTSIQRPPTPPTALLVCDHIWVRNLNRITTRAVSNACPDRHLG